MSFCGGVRCHAGPDKPAPAIGKPGASSLDFWIPAFAGMTIRRKWPGYEKENTNFVTLPLSQGEGTSGDPTASGWGIKNIINRPLKCWFFTAPVPTCFKKCLRFNFSPNPQTGQHKIIPDRVIRHYRPKGLGDLNRRPYVRLLPSGQV